MNLLWAQIEASTVAQIVSAFDGEDEEMVRQAIQNGTCFEEMLRAAVAELNDAEAMTDAMAKRAKQLTDRKKRKESYCEKLRTTIADLMNRANVRKLELEEATLSIAPSGRSVVITNEGALPEQFTRTKREPNKTAIKEALERGEEVPGAELGNGGESLRIRRT